MRVAAKITIPPVAPSSATGLASGAEHFTGSGVSNGSPNTAVNNSMVYSAPSQGRMAHPTRPHPWFSERFLVPLRMWQKLFVFGQQLCGSGGLCSVQTNVHSGCSQLNIKNWFDDNGWLWEKLFFFFGWSWTERNFWTFCFCTHGLPHWL